MLRVFIHFYGCPEELLSDRGSQVTYEMITALCKQLEVKKIYTCAYRFASNGLHEHLKWMLFSTVKMYASQKPSTWREYVDSVTSAFRITAHSVTMHSLTVPYRDKFATRHEALYSSIYGGLPEECAK